MRADRELRHNTALGPDDVKTFQTALTQLHGQEMDAWFLSSYLFIFVIVLPESSFQHLPLKLFVRF